MLNRYGNCLTKWFNHSQSPVDYCIYLKQTILLSLYCLVFLTCIHIFMSVYMYVYVPCNY